MSNKLPEPHIYYDWFDLREFAAEQLKVEQSLIDEEFRIRVKYLPNGCLMRIWLDDESNCEDSGECGSLWSQICDCLYIDLLDRKDTVLRMYVWW